MTLYRLAQGSEGSNIPVTERNAIMILAREQPVPILDFASYNIQAISGSTTSFHEQIWVYL